jgi:manganese efflux pump family protein
MLATLAIALGLSADSFAAALGMGAARDRLRRAALREALAGGVLFAAVAAAMPLIGWAAGRAASGFIGAYDHWVAFAVLSAIGITMLRASLKPRSPAPVRSFGILIAAAFATSIDALAVGVTMALLGAGIVATALAIGGVAFLVTVSGLMLGRALGEKAGRAAEALGGLTLIAVGANILAQHLS